MADFKERIDELARLMDEFQLAEARLESDGMTVGFRRRTIRNSKQQSESTGSDELDFAPVPAPVQFSPVEEKALGTPIVSPMMGIFYDAPSPGSSPFVKEGDEVSVGQVIGLIEAMKVFNEIPCTRGGKVLRLVAEPGGVVQPGDTLLILE